MVKNNMILVDVRDNYVWKLNTKMYKQIIRENAKKMKCRRSKRSSSI